MVTGDQLAIARETAKALGMGTNILELPQRIAVAADTKMPSHCERPPESGLRWRLAVRHRVCSSLRANATGSLSVDVS